MFLEERASFRSLGEAVSVDWTQTEDVATIIRLLSVGNAGDKLRAYKRLETFDDAAFRHVAAVTVSQRTVHGLETRSIESYLSAALICAVRDFTDTDSGVDAACEGVKAAVRLGDRASGLRKAARHQIRRTLNSETWRLEREASGIWHCPYCGADKKDDGDGFPRVCHLRFSHPESLPSRTDLGCPTSWNRRFVWNHLLLTLSGLVRSRSWPNHRHYFVGTALEDALERHFSREGTAAFVYRGSCNILPEH